MLPRVLAVSACCVIPVKPRVGRVQYLLRACVPTISCRCTFLSTRHSVSRANCCRGLVWNLSLCSDRVFVSRNSGAPRFPRLKRMRGRHSGRSRSTIGFSIRLRLRRLSSLALPSRTRSNAAHRPNLTIRCPHWRGSRPQVTKASRSESVNYRSGGDWVVEYSQHPPTETTWERVSILRGIPP